MRLTALVSIALFVGAGTITQGAEAPATPSPAVDVLAAAAVVGAPRGAPLSGAALESETRRVGLLLRCPVCQGLSIAESPADTAVNMLTQVRDLLAAGYSEPQILAYFEHSYGEFVRLEPALRGVNWMLWLAPILGLGAGAVVVVALARRAHRASAPPQEEQAPAVEDPELAKYVQRVRALVRGSGSERQRKP